MKMAVRDRIFITIIVMVLMLLLFATLRKRPPATPADATHLPFLQALGRGESRTEVERRCPECHNPRDLPFPGKHPPKEQCLICHRPAEPGPVKGSREK
jgi:hypothetical protein